ncbi:MAG TPA: hypothetical protein VJM33_19385 [Microthrixaceae bacterium]|nr:hypothetical protein [Microthrixaceae bacterium]
MSDGPQPDQVDSDAEHRDELPEDLDASAAINVTFPDNNRRRIPATIYVLLGAACIVWYATSNGETPLVNIGVMWAGVALVAFGIYGFVAGRSMRIDEQEALVAATRSVGFPVGHASAQMTWRGLLSRPAWRLLLYSAENPPTRRAFVVVDAIDGTVLEGFDEENPEDW